jgi:hypothetical protein
MYNNNNSPTGMLVKFLIRPQKMINFTFGYLTDMIIEMWASAEDPLRKNFLDYVIITAINQRGSKGITRQQYVELAYLLVPDKVKRSSKSAIEKYENISGFFDYL